MQGIATDSGETTSLEMILAVLKIIEVLPSSIRNNCRLGVFIESSATLKCVEFNQNLRQRQGVVKKANYNNLSIRFLEIIKYLYNKINEF